MVKEAPKLSARETRGESIRANLATYGLETLSFQQEGEIFSAFTRHVRVGFGIEKGTSSLLTAPSYLHPISHDIFDKQVVPGEEVAVVEIGGTNIYAARVSKGEKLNGNAVTVKESTKRGMSNKRYETAEDFFAEVADIVKPLFPEEPTRLGVIWSFPGDSMSTHYGVDVISHAKLPKELFIGGIEKSPVGQQILQALGTREDIPLAVMNDTVAVLLAGFGEVGGIFGTGFNLATTYSGAIYNLEAGGFSEVPQTSLTQKIDRESEYPGKQLAEKQISGLYISRMFNAAIAALSETGAIDYTKTRDLHGPDITAILSKEKEQIEKSFPGVSDDTLLVIEEVAKVIVERSAQIGGSMIAALVSQMENPEVTVPIEGSVFTKTPGYPEMLQQVIDRHVKDKKVRLVAIEQGGIKGASIAALAINEHSLRRSI